MICDRKFVVAVFDVIVILRYWPPYGPDTLLGTVDMRLHASQPLLGGASVQEERLACGFRAQMNGGKRQVGEGSEEEVRPPWSGLPEHFG